MKIRTALLALSGIVTASRAVINPNALLCEVINDLVTLAHEQSLATSFCSSLLSAPRSTVTTTSTKITSTQTSTVTVTGGPVTVTAPTLTRLIPAPSLTTVFTPSTVTQTVTTTGTLVVFETITELLDCVRSAATTRAAVPKPPCISAYLGGSLATTVCGCLSVRPATAAATSTVVQPVVSTVTATRTVATTTTTFPVTATFIPFTVTITSPTAVTVTTTTSTLVTLTSILVVGSC